MPRAAQTQPAPEASAKRRPAWLDAFENAPVDAEPELPEQEALADLAEGGPSVPHETVLAQIAERRRRATGR